MCIRDRSTIDSVRDVFFRFSVSFNAYFAWSAFPRYCRSIHWVRWETEWSFDGKLCEEYWHQNISKSDGCFSRYSQKCWGCFFETQCSSYSILTTDSTTMFSQQRLECYQSLTDVACGSHLIFIMELCGSLCKLQTEKLNHSAAQ